MRPVNSYETPARPVGLNYASPSARPFLDAGPILINTCAFLAANVLLESIIWLVLTGLKRRYGIWPSVWLDRQYIQTLFSEIAVNLVAAFFFFFANLLYAFVCLLLQRPSGNRAGSWVIACGSAVFCCLLRWFMFWARYHTDFGFNGFLDLILAITIALGGGLTTGWWGQARARPSDKQSDVYPVVPTSE